MYNAAMRLAWTIVVAAGTSASAVAKPLPPDLKIVISKDHLAATKGGVTVPLFASNEGLGGLVFQTLSKAELSADGKMIELHAAGCIEVGGDDEPPIEVSLASVEAKFENYAGMQQHLKKKYADAIAHFAAAAKDDPDLPLYATNLLSAQTMSGKLDDADQTLAIYGARAVAWFGWRLAVDSDLKALKGRPSTKPFVAATPTKIAFDVEHDVAISPLGIVAVGEWIAQGMGPAATEVGIYDVKRNALALRLPVNDASCVEQSSDMVNMPACTKAQRAYTKANVAAADAQLAAYGMATRKTVWTDMMNVDTSKIVSPDKSITLSFHDGVVTATHGKATTTLKDVEDNMLKIGWAGDIVVIMHKQPYQCGGADSVRSYFDVLAVP
jgi:hypothetical protein